MRGKWTRMVAMATAFVLLASGCGVGAARVLPTATPAKPAEALATKNADIIGVWEVPGLDKSTLHMEYKEDGTYLIRGVAGNAKGAKVDDGRFSFEAGQLKIEPTEGCFNVQGQQVTGIGLYQIYLAKQGDKTVGIKFVLVQDPCTDRRDTFTNKTMVRAVPLTSRRRSAR